MKSGKGLKMFGAVAAVAAAAVAVGSVIFMRKKRELECEDFAESDRLPVSDAECCDTGCCCCDDELDTEVEVIIEGEAADKLVVEVEDELEDELEDEPE